MYIGFRMILTIIIKLRMKERGKLLCIYVTVNLYNQVICMLPDVFS